MQTNSNEELNYTGFDTRFLASIIDMFIMIIVIALFLFVLPWMDEGESISTHTQYSWSYLKSTGLTYYATPVFIIDFLINHVFPFLVVMLFWFYFLATLGKILFSVKIVDARTGNKPTILQFIIRYLGCFLSFMLFGLGFLWIIWDKKKQGWHDKLARTVVVDKRKKSVYFEDKNEDKK